MVKQYNPGDVEVLGVKLYNIDESAKIDIMGQLVSIDIFESILNSTIYCELKLFDGIDLLNTFPIVAEEKIEISFKTGQHDTKEYTFHIAQIKDIKDIYSEKGKSYTLRLFSEEHFINQTFKISKSYSSTSSDIVKDLFSNFKSKKRLYVETSKGIEEILTPKLHVFQNIDLVRSRAVSLENISSSYVFFENHNGYNFVTIEKMMEDGKTNIGDKKFIYSQAPNLDIDSSKYRNILGMTKTRSTNSVEKLNFGKSYSVRTFDILTGETSQYSYDNEKDQHKYKFMEKTNPNNSSKFEEKYNNGYSQVYFIPKDSSKSENFVEEKILYSIAFNQKILQDSNIINVWGDSSLLAGDVIECSLPTGLVSLKKADKKEKLYTGNYLIHTLRHNITLFSPNHKYYCSMALLKGNFEDIT